MKITDLKKEFGAFSISIERMQVQPGRISGLIGPNGCGKTTTVKLMAGLLEPDNGTIDREGLCQRDITLVPRKPYFLHDSVYRNLVYPLKLRGIKPDRELVDHYLELIGFGDRRKQYAPSLSNGEQQKLSLVRALIFSPRLVLVDEAFSNLDMESVDLFERLILEQQAQSPSTWVVVSHQISHIQRLCGHVFFMDGGSLAAEGPVEEMLLRPSCPQLQRYLRQEAVKVDCSA